MINFEIYKLNFKIKAIKKDLDVFIKGQIWPQAEFLKSLERLRRYLLFEIGSLMQYILRKEFLTFLLSNHKKIFADVENLKYLRKKELQRFKKNYFYFLKVLGYYYEPNQQQLNLIVNLVIEYIEKYLYVKYSLFEIVE
ncbi:hypothetical protein [Candidatus Phytoplasma pyri]|uniref:hypothetical protein n=1 Tax=Candidatus Phytoplasma pyri TaxID=47566 RepID=UPI00398362ED